MKEKHSLDSINSAGEFMDVSRELASQKIGETLESIIKMMCDYPDEAYVKWNMGEHTSVFTVYTSKNDLGKIIGKQGQNIHALRTLLKTFVSKYKIRAVIETLD